MLPMLPTPRPVDDHWTCHRSGDCCTKPLEVVMTKEEQLVLFKHIPQGIETSWRDIDEKFVALKAQPCPLYAFKGCVVYAVRPYSCRRFACMRPNPKKEPFEQGGPLGCMNLSDRVSTSRVALRLAKLIQRRAQKWALRHGWTSDDPISDVGA